jgi:nucleoside-triphosphatase THEP1
VVLSPAVSVLERAEAPTPGGKIGDPLVYKYIYILHTLERSTINAIRRMHTMDDVMIAYIGELMDAEVDRLERKVCRAMDARKDEDAALGKLAWAEAVADVWHSIKWVPSN